MYTTFLLLRREWRKGNDRQGERELLSCSFCYKLGKSNDWRTTGQSLHKQERTTRSRQEKKGAKITSLFPPAVFPSQVRFLLWIIVLSSGRSVQFTTTNDVYDPIRCVCTSRLNEGYLLLQIHAVQQPFGRNTWLLLSDKITGTVGFVNFLWESP